MAQESRHEGTHHLVRECVGTCSCMCVERAPACVCLCVCVCAWVRSFWSDARGVDLRRCVAGPVVHS